MTIINEKISFNKQILFLLCCSLFFLALNMIVSTILIKLGGLTAATMRISIVLQNLIAMTLPALVTAILISRNPLKLFCLDKLPKWQDVVFMLLIMWSALPAMNWLVEWNAGVTLPESMSHLEDILREMENEAEEFTKMLLVNDSVYSLIVTVLAVGVFTGFGEEILFRGTLQRVIELNRVNAHVAIWLTAFIFSAIHLQFFGFFPRMILGAFFGYLLWWSKSLWLPIIAHALNNSSVIINSYIYGAENVVDMNTIGLEESGSFPVLVVVSVLLTVVWLCLYIVWNKRRRLLADNREK